MGLEPTNLLTASQALYQLSYAPAAAQSRFSSEAFPVMNIMAAESDCNRGKFIVAEVQLLLDYTPLVLA